MSDTWLSLAHSTWHQTPEMHRPPCPSCGWALGMWCGAYKCFNNDCQNRHRSMPPETVPRPKCPICHGGEAGMLAYLRTLRDDQAHVLTPEEARREAEGFTPTTDEWGF